MRLALLTAAVLACASCGNGAAPITSSMTSAGVAMASAVDVRASGCRTEEIRGAGAMIDGGFILTAAHVVAGADSITVRPASSPDSFPEPTHLVALDRVNDLALLTPAGLRLPALPLGAAAPASRGTTVVFRDDRPTALPLTVTKPVVVRILDIYHEAKISRPGYQVEVEIAAGDSGAVVVTDTGKAAGVLYARSRDSDRRAWATDTSAVQTLLEATTEVDPETGIDTGECVG